MNTSERKKVAVITKYVLESFAENDWHELGQITGKLKTIIDHDRLFRSMHFGDPDYDYCVAEVLDQIFSDEAGLIEAVVDHFDIDLWYKQKEPEKYKRVFANSSTHPADFWKEGYLRAFVSHLSSNKERTSAMKEHLGDWGISAFIAHEDIEPSREWIVEIEAGLDSMDLLIAVVEPGFKESDWCAQEVGHALGRKVDIIPLRAGLDPFGFFGKYQGIQIKGKVPAKVANEIAQTLLKKPQHRTRLVQSMSKAFASLQADKKISQIFLLDSWSTVTDAQLRSLLEQSSLTDSERISLKDVIARVSAFKKPTQSTAVDVFDDVPF